MATSPFELIFDLEDMVDVSLVRPVPKIGQSRGWAVNTPVRTLTVMLDAMTGTLKADRQAFLSADTASPDGGIRPRVRVTLLDWRKNPCVADSESFVVESLADAAARIKAFFRG